MYSCFLFNGKGSIVKGMRGRSYNEADFDTQYFLPDWHVSYNRLGNGCKIVFPIIYIVMLSVLEKPRSLEVCTADVSEDRHKHCL